MKNLIDILIPTYNNFQQLKDCLQSILVNRAGEGLFHIYIINNGNPNSCDWIENKDVTVLQAGGENLGWVGGLKLGLEKARAPFVVFMNDDTVVPPTSRYWLNNMIQYFKDPEIAAVGPSSNVVMGWQNIFVPLSIYQFSVELLIFFCVMLRREAMEKVGGLDDSLLGGDDFDLCIRLRDAGYVLVCDRNTFIFHHGFQTGTRIFGDHTKPSGWNSPEYKERVDHQIIRKHGFKRWWQLMKSVSQPLPFESLFVKMADKEKRYIKKQIKGKVILDLGCANNKTVPEAIGVDLVKKDEVIETLVGRPKSQADIQHDVSTPLPFEKNYADTIIARHILEHMIDPLESLRHWLKVLKKNGRLIVAVPNDEFIKGIPMNIEHLHAFTPSALKNLFATVGLKNMEIYDPKNNISFIIMGEKI